MPPLSHANENFMSPPPTAPSPSSSGPNYPMTSSSPSMMPAGFPGMGQPGAGPPQNWPGIQNNGMPGGYRPPSSMPQGMGMPSMPGGMGTGFMNGMPPGMFPGAPQNNGLPGAPAGFQPRMGMRIPTPPDQGGSHQVRAHLVNLT